MKKIPLLPCVFKPIGWAILVPAALLGLCLLLNDFNGLPAGLPFPAVRTELLNNVALIGTLLGVLFVGCSRERIEDELIGRLRLDALLTALYANTIVIIAAALACYGLDFLYVMIYNLLTLPLLFLAIYQWQLWRLRKEACDEK